MLNCQQQFQSLLQQEELLYINGQMNFYEGFHQQIANKNLLEVEVDSSNDTLKYSQLNQNLVGYKIANNNLYFLFLNKTANSSIILEDKNIQSQISIQSQQKNKQFSQSQQSQKQEQELQQQQGDSFFLQQQINFNFSFDFSSLTDIQQNHHLDLDLFPQIQKTQNELYYHWSDSIGQCQFAFAIKGTRQTLDNHYVQKKLAKTRQTLLIDDERIKIQIRWNQMELLPKLQIKCKQLNNAFYHNRFFRFFPQMVQFNKMLDIEQNFYHLCMLYQSSRVACFERNLPLQVLVQIFNVVYNQAPKIDLQIEIPVRTRISEFCYKFYNWVIITFCKKSTKSLNKNKIFEDALNQRIQLDQDNYQIQPLIQNSSQEEYYLN